MFIIDTNVVSELRKKERGDPRVAAWAARQDRAQFHLSCITVLELRYGALLLQRRDPVQCQLMLAWIQRDILDAFARRILPIDTGTAMQCAVLHVPDRRPERDAFIAATALVHDFTVVTRNTRDFEPMGVKLFNPWISAEG